MSGYTFYMEKDSVPQIDTEVPSKTLPPGNPGFNSLPGRDQMDPSSAKVIPDSMKQKLEENTTASVAYRVFRPEGWGALGREMRKEMSSWPDLAWRGMTEAEYKATVGGGKPIQSRGSYSLEGEGTNFATDPRDAESYINFGRDDPRTTGRPTYLVGVRRTPDMVLGRDGYLKAQGPTPLSEVRVVWEMWGEDDEVRGRAIRAGMAARVARTFMSRTAATSREAAKLDEILRRTSPDIIQKSQGVQLRRKQLNSKTGFWLYEAAGSKGKTYKVRVKAEKKGNINRPSKLQFKVSCTCPFWQWQGPEHWAKVGGYLYGKPVGTAAKPTVKDPKGDHWCCKHVAAVIAPMLKRDSIMSWGKWASIRTAASREGASPSRVASAWVRNKTACIISVGEWGGKKCLFKNRDRNYTPEVRVYHELIDGVEVLYMKDELTGWCEGLNEYGIGVVNAALAVHADEKAGKAGKGKSDDPSTQNTLKDGKRTLKSLSCKDLTEAVDTLQSYLGGLRGHTFLASPEETWSLEATWRGHDFHKRKLPQSRKHVRTNHGQYHQDAGYTEKDGENYLSSLARRDQAMKLLRGIGSPEEIAPAIYGKRREDRTDPLNMVKMTDGMRTNTQTVLNLTDREMLLYLLPGQVEFLGYENKLPKGRKPKVSLKLIEYTDLDDDGEFETSEVSLKTAAMKGVRDLEAREAWVGIFGDLSSVTISLLEGDDSSFGTLYLQRRGNLLQVRDVEAESGWGPLLYDLALDVASEFDDDGVIPDRDVVLKAAERVWEHYRDRRSDVEATPLDPGTRGWDRFPPDSPLSYSYRRTSGSTLRELMRQDLLEADDYSFG